MKFLESLSGKTKAGSACEGQDVGGGQREMDRSIRGRNQR